MKQLVLLVILLIAITSCKDTKPKQKEKGLEKQGKLEKNLGIEQANLKKALDSENDDTVCKCFNGIGASEGDEPALLFTFSNGNSTAICGYVEEDLLLEGLIISEFNIFECKSGKSLVEFDALQTCRITEAEDKLIIEELKFLPIGKNWNWEFIQIAEQIIIMQDHNLLVNSSTPKFTQVDIDKTQQSEFLNSITQNEGIGNDWENELGKLEVLSLLGNEKAWQILRKYDNYKSEIPDGAAAEQWKDAMATVEWINGK